MSDHKALVDPARSWPVWVPDRFGGHWSRHGTCGVCWQECVTVFRSGWPDALALWRHLPKGS